MAAISLTSMTWSVRSLVAGAAAEAMSLGQEWLDETPPEEGALFVAGENMNMLLPSIMVRRAIKAGRVDDWLELMRIAELNHWMMAKLKESYH